MGNEMKLVLAKEAIAERIMVVREKQVIIDHDLAAMYGVTVKRLKEQVGRNMDRFPERFRFRLTDKPVANCGRFNSLKHSTVKPWAFARMEADANKILSEL